MTMSDIYNNLIGKVIMVIKNNTYYMNAEFQESSKVLSHLQ